MTFADYYIEQGIEQGRQEVREAFIPKLRLLAEMLLSSKNDDEISEMAGLSLEEVQQIRDAQRS